MEAKKSMTPKLVTEGVALKLGTARSSHRPGIRGARRTTDSLMQSLCHPAWLLQAMRKKDRRINKLDSDIQGHHMT